uniref:FHA domain-containing protein n=1 Tax=Wuchereria bancrofti TaxID=6293 RepID=A0AAF5PW22_WUCBA
MAIYQLRRLHVSQSSQSLLPDDTVLLYQTTKIGRNPDLVDVVLISQVHSNMISREHTTIFVKAKRDRYACFIKDHSLNGTYVNDFRVSGEAELQQGDVIKFGHVNGAAIKPGCYGPQTSAEFTFVFEEAPAHRLNDRRRPITIMGNARQDLSQMFVGDGKNLHTATSRLPLANPSMELTSSWQNPAATAGAAAAAAAAPFYNLQRFPGYYQAAFPQLSSAYLHSLWPQNPWPSQSSTAAQQFQQHQLKQQKQVEAVAATAAQYGQLTNAAWMGANAQIASDSSSFMGTTGDNRLRAVVSEEVSSPRLTSNITFQMASSAAVTGPCSQRSTTTIAPITDHSVVSQNINAQNNQLLHSLAHHTSASRSARIPISATVSGNIPITRNSGTTATRQHHYSTNSRIVDAQRISRLTTDCSSSQVIATPSAIDCVKRMECDSSVPSPPKNQQQQATAAMFGTGVSTGIVGIQRATTATAAAAAAVSSQLSLSPITAIHAPIQVQAQTATQLQAPTLTKSAAISGSERRFNNDRISAPISTGSIFTVSNVAPTSMTTMNMGAVTSTAARSVPSAMLSQMSMSSTASSVMTQEKPMEELQRENAERNSRLSGLEELTEDLLEDCGPPRRVSTPASSSSELPNTSIVKQDILTTEEPKPSETLCSPPHQSPKRRGHGHSDSSCSPTQTPIVLEQKVAPKRRRKNNEVAMLLNDLTEVAWHHLARKSTNKITVPTQTRKVYTHDEDDDTGNRSCKSDSSGTEKITKKKQQQKNITKGKSASSAKNITSSKAIDSDNGIGRKRGRPKKDYLTSENITKKKVTVKKKKKKRSSSSDSISSDSENDKEERRKNLKKLQTLPKNQPGTSAAEKIERAFDMMKKRQTLPESDNESSNSSFMSSSSPSPIRRTWGTTSQRKIGHTSGNGGVNKKKMNKTNRQSRSLSKVPRKQSNKGIATSSTNIRKKGRKKKKRSSSSESELSLETSSVEWEKMKPVVTPLQAAHAPIVFDEWTYHDPEKQCDARSGCKKPQSESVVWVQCDYCCRWYHMECVTEHGVTVGNSDDFNCGCRELNKTS